MKNTIKRLLAAFLLATLTLVTARALPDEEIPREKSAAERRADRRFLGQNFNGALSLYKKVMERERDSEKKAILCLKVARLYAMVRDHASAAHYFGLYTDAGNELPSASDIRDYLDALRFLGERQKAEAVCLHYAYENAYSRNQRYRNALNALTMQYDTIASDYIVIPTRANTTRSEYWVGSFKGRPFHAASRSNLNAPGKIFFHRTRYRLLDNPAYYLQRDLNRHFADVPRELQCGPVSFTPDARQMVATEIIYSKNERVRIDEGRDLTLRTRLVYSSVSKTMDRFSRFTPLFQQEEGSSYAHPFFFDNGNAILFTSDMPGGYGGFDLYLSIRDEDGEWGYPLNLGPTVNTEGDEIFPLLFEDELFFSSNGHLGLGGYDLFRARFSAASVVPNSLYHLPYPLNTSYNDFNIYPIDQSSGYIASDRNEKEKDNIFFYRKRGENLAPDLDRTEQSLLNSDSTPEEVILGQEVEKELLDIVYFDFDKVRVNSEAVHVLRNLLKTYGKELAGLHIIGYADEMGKDDYNHSLSIKRARAVAEWLREHDVLCHISVEGRGKIVLPREVRRQETTLSETIARNRDARRVEIYLILEQIDSKLNR
ncbi:MAG: OmpA family protein [Odoribacteraceae bacterium]|jgi:outer membrane protein OmpA-like peptidoglycan-associated protein|nr:OmpA family protein [Odoribacteraceae bacterium]